MSKVITCEPNVAVGTGYFLLNLCDIFVNGGKLIIHKF